MYAAAHHCLNCQKLTIGWGEHFVIRSAHYSCFVKKKQNRFLSRYKTALRICFVDIAVERDFSVLPCIYLNVSFLLFNFICLWRIKSVDTTHVDVILSFCVELSKYPFVSTGK